MNKLTRKISVITSILVTGSVLSCDKTFLDAEPFGSVNEGLLAASESGAEALLIAAYSNLDGFSGWEKGNIWGGAASNWVYGSICGGDAHKGSDAGDQGDVTPLEIFSADANNPYNLGKWGMYYDGISRTNVAIKTFKALENISDANRSLRLAEAQTLRAWYHYDLYKIFRNIPYITEDLEDVRIGNEADPLPKMQADLLSAIPNLPLTQPDPGRMTKGAAQAILGQTYMWQGKFSEAKAQFDAIMTSGRYKLLDKYSDVFDIVNRNTDESILEAQATVNDGTDSNGNIGDVLNFPYGGGPAGCCGFHQPSQNLVNAFQVDANGLPLLDTYGDHDLKSDEGIPSKDPFQPDVVSPIDPRLDHTVGRRGIPYLDWGIMPGSSWIRSPIDGGPYVPIKNVFSQAADDAGSYTATGSWTKGYSASNIKLIRYSDVILMAAEAEAQLGNLAKSMQLVNMVRARAQNEADFVLHEDGTPAGNYKVGLYSSFPDKDYALKAVRHERRIELGMEGHRFFDLVRWGIAKQELEKYWAKEKIKRTYLVGASFTAGKHERFAIPQRAITQSANENGPTIKQNPGY